MQGQDDYVCTLDEASIKKAKDELNEDPTDRLAAVQALREWLLAQPHIHSRTDTAFLLRFLRYKKFSQLEARKGIQGYWAMREKNSDWYQNINTRDPDFIRALNDGVCCILPGRTPAGETILLFDEGKFDPKFKRYSKETFFKMCIAVFDAACLDEMTQVNGVQFIADLTTFTAKHQMAFSLSDMKRSTDAWQGHFPARFKGFHYYNAGAFIEWISGIFKAFMNKKFIDRFKVHDTMEKVYASIPMHMLPAEYLPDNHQGPNAGTFAELKEKTKELMLSDRIHQYFLNESNPKWRVDKSKKPAEQIPQQHYRKFND